MAEQKTDQSDQTKPKTSSLDSSFPVFVPEDPALTCSEDEFQAYLVRTLKEDIDEQVEADKKRVKTEKIAGKDDTGTLTTSSWVKGMDELHVQSVKSFETHENMDMDQNKEQSSQQLESASNSPICKRKRPSEDGEDEEDESTEDSPPDMERKMLTANNDVALRSTSSPVVDLFFENNVANLSSSQLDTLLSASWAVDSTLTLRILFLTRSIHLGKGDRQGFYDCFSWLMRYHPLTALNNLKWLNRNLIEKKVKPDDTDKIESKDPIEFSNDSWDVRNGVAHGYWKDLLNILVLYARKPVGSLRNPGLQAWFLQEPADRSGAKRHSREVAKELKHKLEAERHSKFLAHFNHIYYRRLHLIIARLFASQLRVDLDLLKIGSASQVAKMSLAAKWAPSLESFHDKHTFIASSIAEILFPRDRFEPSLDRSEYLKHARESYRKLVLSPLRKALRVIERDVTSESFSSIDYSRVPSLAMQRYQDLFVKKDQASFLKYLEDVATGTAHISGAVLTPALLVKPYCGDHRVYQKVKESTALSREARLKVSHAQWNSLVQRIRDSGALDGCIAIADVSGSMEYPWLPDETTPMHSSIGLGLLVAEVCSGAVITFSEEPSIVEVGGLLDTRSFGQKVTAIAGMPWGGSTNFVAAFELLLAQTKSSNRQFKKVFVFSDMHFNAAELHSRERWQSSYERIKKRYTDAGFELPELVFWNLAGDHTYAYDDYDTTAPKPADADIPGVSLVSGYNQALLKVFLEGGSFDDAEKEVGLSDDVKMSEEGDAVKVDTKKDALDVVKRATSHKAYQVLEVLD